MAQEKPQKNGKAKAAPRVISLSVSKAATLGVMVVFVVAWAFALGIIVGRGYRPEKAVPEIDRIMPAPPAQDQTADLGVLKPEELNYMDQLSKTPTLPPKVAQAAKEASEKAAEKQRKKAEAAKAEAKAEAKKTEPKKAEPAKPVGATAQKAAPAPAPVATPAPPPMQAQKSVQQVAKAPEATPTSASASDAGQRFAYVYQVAAVDNQASAQALANKIKAAGLFASTEATEVKGKTWHRVLVQFRGTPEETRDMKDRLAKVGIDRVIMKSKTPIK